MLNAIPPGPKTLPTFEADVTYANLEIPLTTSNTATRRKTAAELRARTQFVLKADPGHAPHLAAAGLTLVSLGNNHTMDYGPAGLSETLDALTKAGIAFAGAGPDLAAAKRPAVVTLPSGLRVGLISALAFVTDSALAKCHPATASTPGVFALSLGGQVGPRQAERLRRLVADARQLADVVLVALHWGDERKTNPKPYQVALGRAFVEAGADAVLGAHPHVLQPVEVYRGRPILYSLGNLVSPLPGDTALYRVEFKGRVAGSITVIPARIAGGRLRPLSDRAATKALARIQALGPTFQRTYPHPESRLPSLRLAPLNPAVAR